MHTIKPTKVFNKTTGARFECTQQTHAMLAQLQTAFDIAHNLHKVMQERISRRALTGTSVVWH